MDNIVGRLQSIFPYDQLQLIIGSLLGDARLECRSMSYKIVSPRNDLISSKLGDRAVSI